MLYHALSCYPDARKHIDMLHQRRGKDFNMIALIGARKNINPRHTHDERRPRRTTEKRICLRFWRSKLCYTTLSEAHAPRPTRCPRQQRYPDLPYPTLPYPRIFYTYPTLPYPTLLMFWPLRGPPTIKQRSAVAPPFSRPRVAFFLLPERSYPTLPYPGVGREPLPYPDHWSAGGVEGESNPRPGNPGCCVISTGPRARPTVDWVKPVATGCYPIYRWKGESNPRLAPALLAGPLPYL